MEVVMRAVFSGLSTVMLLLGAVFWLGDEWRWLMDFLLQLFLFCLLGKFILVPASLGGYGYHFPSSNLMGKLQKTYTGKALIAYGLSITFWR